MTLRSTWNTSVLTGILAHVALTGCQSGGAGNVAQPIANNATNLSTYVDAKRAYVTSLEKIVLAHDPSTSPYRLVAIIGPQWGVGDVMELQNPMSLATTSCPAPADAPANAPVTWTAFPELTESKKIVFSAGLPSSVVSIIGKDNKLGVNFDLDSGGSFALTDIQSVIPAQDTFEKNIAGACKDFLTAKGGVLIRGVVNAKEKFGSSRKVDLGASIKLTTDPLFDISYDKTGEFTLEDKASSPKMFLVAYYSVDGRGDGSASGLRKLSDAEVNEFESIKIDGR